MIHFLGFAIVALAKAQAAAARGAPPTEIAGTWDVERVAVDSQDALHWGMHPDDPVLMGRSLIIAPERVQFDSGKEIGCQPFAGRRQQTTWGILFAKGFPRPTDGGRSAMPSPQDFGFEIAKSKRATAFSLCPSNPTKAPRFPKDSWVALRESDLLALHYDTQVLLILRKRAPGARPKASFECTKAATPSEKTICGSFELASWDRSVALAFRNALERQTPQKQAELHRGQKEWLSKRDLCGSDAACLDDAQWRRVAELKQE